jgi:hypothetical protein
VSAGKLGRHRWAAAILLSAVCAGAQQAAPSSGGLQAAPPAAPAQQETLPPPNPGAQVIFSRSGDSRSADQAEARKSAAAPAIHISDAERGAIVFNSYNMDVHLRPADHAIAVRARMEVRNDGSQPLQHLALQLSSTLEFEAVSVGGKPQSFGRQTLNSDTDHTGQIHEAEVALATPLAPGATLRIEAVYSGTIEASAQRLEAIGTPEDEAARSDWDAITAGFTGLRGFGNVLWYPVSSAPALLGDGAKVFDEIGRQKLRQSQATAQVRLTVEYAGDPPTIAIFSGRVLPLQTLSKPTGSYPGVMMGSLGPAPIGFAVPSLLVARRVLEESSGLRIWAQAGDEANAQAYFTAATLLQPMLSQWLGAQKSSLTVLDLPGAEDDAYVQDSTLYTAVAAAPPERLADSLSAPLAHAYFRSPRAWLDEGVARFMQTLWTEQSHDRTLALEELESSRAALAFAEPATPGAGPGEDLMHASDPVYLRTKAAYVLWMLRDVAGDKALQSALQAYDPAADTEPEYFEKLLERAGGKDLRWFFDSWIYNDRGLPDLSIAHVNISAGAHAGEHLVAIDIANDGYAEAEVPVRLRSDTARVTERVRLPGKTHTTHRMLIDGDPTEVTVNDGTVPEVAGSIQQRVLRLAP